MIEVTDIVVTKNAPKVNNATIAKLLPKTIVPEIVSFRIHNVNNAVSNAIRRTLCDELPTIAMNCNYEDIKTNNEFILPEMVMKRLRLIPIDQSVPRDTIFELKAVNKTAQVRDVKSSEIRGMKTLPFNETFTICTLEPAKSIEIKNIRIHSAYGYNEGDGMHVLAYEVVSLAVDQIPINTFEPNDKGLHSYEANPRVWDIKFESHGTIPAHKLVRFACDNIIERLKYVNSILETITYNGDYYTLLVVGETHTIGNLYMKTIIDEFDVDGIYYTVDPFERKVSIKIKYTGDASALIAKTTNMLIKIYEDIKSYFKK